MSKQRSLSSSNLMPIGRFAASCRLSIKALRHYAEQQLLIPAYVDKNTGYRYYSRDQASTAITICMLRTLDMPLATIRDLLKSDGIQTKAILNIEEQRFKTRANEKAAGTCNYQEATKRTIPAALHSGCPIRARISASPEKH